MKYIQSAVVVLGLLASTTMVFAEDEVSATAVTSTAAPTQDDDRKLPRGAREGVSGPKDEAFKARMEEAKRNIEAAKEGRDAAKKEFKDSAEARREEVEGKRDAVKKEFKDAIEAKKGEMKELRGDAKKSIKEAIEVKKTEFKAKIEEIKKEKVAVRRDFVSKKLAESAKILASRQTRVQALLEKMSANGKDVSLATAALQTSVEALAAANASIAKLSAGAPTTEAEAVALRAIAKSAEASLKASREALVKVLDSVVPKPVDAPAAPAVPATTTQ